MLRGKVKWFNNEKGYGFIEYPDKSDIFVHYSAIQKDGYKTLKENSIVTFKLIETSKGLQAVDVVEEQLTTNMQFFSLFCEIFNLVSLNKLKEKFPQKTYVNIIENNIYACDIEPISTNRTKIILILAALLHGENPEEIKSSVVIKVKNKEQSIEVTVPTSKFTLRAEEIHADLYAAIDLVVDKLERQVRKNKTRISERYQNSALFEMVLDNIEDEEQDDGKYGIINVK